ncbi:MAG: TonB-dependent receptor plug domain-containing protein, partial [bacterium]
MSTYTRFDLQYLRIIICAVVCLMMPLLVFAQNVVKGTIVDQQTGDPIAGATLVLEGSGINGTTDELGKFSISYERDFTTIVVTRIGYLRKSVSLNDKNKSLTIQLTPITLTLTGVEVVGSTQLSKAQSIGQLTPKDLARANGLTLENSINTIPGVFMQSRTPWGGQRISIRGYYPNFSTNSNGFGYQLFVNNIPVTDATGLTIMDDIDFSTLGNVEVIKGPASSLYGSQIAGTVNLTTAKPVSGQTSIDEQAIGGSYGLFRNNISLQSGGENSDITVNYGHQTYKGFREHTASQKDFVRFTGDVRPNENQTLSSYFSFSRSYEEIAGELDSADFYNRVAPPQRI